MAGEPDRVRLLVMDEDRTVREALSALADALPLAIAYARPDRAGLESLKDTQPQVVLLDGRRMRDHLPALMDALGHLTELSELILFSEGVDVRSPAPGIRVVLRTADTGALAAELRSALEPVLTRLPGTLRFLEAPGGPRADHLQWLGSLSAMLAHEILSPVDAALRFLRLARHELRHGRSALPQLDEVANALTHVSRIGRSLLAFERTLSSPRPSRPLGELLDEVIAYVRTYADHPARVVVDLAAPEMVVPASLFQVLANLLSNSMAALAGAGVVRVTSRPEGSRLRIAVEDNGPGIPPEIREHLFRPFFSTKPFGRGTGLGLPICRQIMLSLGGSLTIDSGPQGGTVATVTLPGDWQDHPTNGAHDAAANPGLR